MRKLSTLAFLAALVLGTASAQAAFVDNAPLPQARGSFSGPVSGAMADTVSKARELSDDAPVVLTGNIVSRLAGSKNGYIFKDATGEIPVRIGEKVFRGQNITPDDTVRITGKVDKDWGKELKIKARTLEIVR